MAYFSRNLLYMEEKYGFSIPQPHLCKSTKRLLGYLGEKVGLGHMCIMCQRAFPSTAAAQQHMRDMAHQRMRFEEDNVWEYEAYYRKGYGVTIGPTECVLLKYDCEVDSG